jgi:hypothetical protein
MLYRTLIPANTILAATDKLPFFAEQSLQDERIARAPGTTVVIVVETSTEAIPRPREDAAIYDALVEALDGVPYDVLIALNSETQIVVSQDLPEPEGPPDFDTLGDLLIASTPLYTLLILAGLPASEEARGQFDNDIGNCSGRVDVLYFGPSIRQTTRNYHATIAATGAGRYVECELPRITRVLGPVVRGLVNSGVP